MPEPIRIAAAVIESGNGLLFLVRKRGTAAFMQAGGKIEPGEAPADALVRELDEELGYRPEPAAIRHIGRFSADAANEPGHTVEAELFRVFPPSAPFKLGAEIEQGIWVSPESAARLELAPLTRLCVLPMARRTFR
jgi:8-oxo-dGTP diphosphatase